MFKNEIKTELKQMLESKNAIDKELTNIKIAIHNLDKLGYNTELLENEITNVGIEFYKLKMSINDLIKEKRGN